MEVLIDTNVLIDFIGDREGFVDVAKKVVTLCSSGQIEGYICAHSLMDLCYIYRKQKTQQERLDMLHQLCGIFTTVETTADSIIAAAERMDFSDFEDSVVNQDAIKAGVEYIVTRNENDYKTADATVISPADFIKLFAEPEAG